MLIDSHIHLHEFGAEDISKLCSRKDLLMLAVSDDYPSSIKTLEITKTCVNAVPAVGIHPWKVKEESLEEELRKLKELLSEVRFLGEIGLDRRFTPETFNEQIELLKALLKEAERRRLGVSIHAAGAWREVIDLLSTYDVKAVAIHWFTGPSDVLKNLLDKGYYVGINVAALNQRKHREVIKKVPITSILTESDGPYRYRGAELMPSKLPYLIKLISELNGTPPSEVEVVIEENFRCFLREAGVTLP